MKRPASHQTEDQAKLIFRSALPREWAIREQHSDYGVDLEVEVFQGGSSTGTLIKVQVKGTKSLKLNAERSVISYPLRTNSAAYLCNELRLPTVFVVADVESSQAYWTAPQLDDTLRRAVRGAGAARRRTVTVHVPTANVLPQTSGILVNACADAQIRLGVRTVAEAYVPTFVAAVTGAYDPDELARALATKGAALRVQQMHDLYKQDNLVEARSLLERVVATPDAAPEVRFHALFLAEQWEVIQLRFPPDTFDMEPKLRLSFAERMRQITGGGPLVLRLHAAIARKTAELHLLSFEDWGLYQNWIAQQATGDPAWRLHLAYRRRQVAERLLRKYRHCGRLMNFALRSQHPAVIPDAAHRIAAALGLLTGRLDSEGLCHAADSYRDSHRQLAEIGIEVAAARGRWDEVALITSDTFLLLAGRQDPAGVEAAAAWAESHLRKIADDACRSRSVALLHKHKAGLLQERSTKKDGHDQAVEQQIYRQMAGALGIDLADPNDPLAVMVRQGLADLNPGRVLRFCKHLFVSLGSGGLPAVLIRLPTAGIKRLQCTVHGYGVEAFALDDCSEGMQQEFCSKCGDREPHSADWEWTNAWKQNQNAIFGHLADDAKQR
jgi:hypothetical protein